MGGPLVKHKLEGIGAASASAVFAALLSNPTTAALTAGVIGKILYWLLTKFFSALASGGLVLLNVGASRIETMIESSKFDGSWDNAEEFIKAIRDTGRDLTPEEITKIDAPVIDAFRKWASFARKKK